MSKKMGKFHTKSRANKILIFMKNDADYFTHENLFFVNEVIRINVSDLVHHRL